MGLTIEQRVELIRRGEAPQCICRVPSGWVVLSDWQVLPGYCILLADPVVPRLNDLEDAARTGFLHEMSLIGDVLLDVTGALRINYEILGNQGPGLHAHIIPRYASEPEEYLRGPIWLYEQQATQQFDVVRDVDLMRRLREAIRVKIP